MCQILGFKQEEQAWKIHIVGRAILKLCYKLEVTEKGSRKIDNRELNGERKDQYKWQMELNKKENIQQDPRHPSLLRKKVPTLMEEEQSAMAKRV